MGNHSKQILFHALTLLGVLIVLRSHAQPLVATVCKSALFAS